MKETSSSLVSPQPADSGRPAVSSSASLRPATVSSSLWTCDFALLVVGLGISLFANLMLRFGMSMWVLDETGSSVAFASILTASVIPTIILTPFGGVLADRMDRRDVMVALDALSAATVLVSALVFSSLGFRLATVAAMQVVLAVLDALETPTVQAALPQMFRRQGADALRRATAVVSAVSQAGMAVPALLGGTLYSLVGMAPMMGLAVVGFALAAVVERFIRLGAPARDGGARASSPLGDLGEAARFLTRERPRVLRLLLLCAALNFLITGCAEVGFPYTVRTVLGFDATIYGVACGLVGASGMLGALAGGRVASRLSTRRLPAVVVAFALAILPQAVVMAASAADVVRFAVLTAGTCGTMIAVCLFNLIAVPAVQMSCPEGLTGKVTALAQAASMCAQPLGQMAYGWAYGVWPVGTVLFMTSALALACSAAALRVTRRP